MTSDAEVWKLQQEIPSDPSIGSGLIQPLLEAMTQFEWEDLDLFRVQLAYEEATELVIKVWHKEWDTMADARLANIDRFPKLNCDI